MKLRFLGLLYSCTDALRGATAKMHAAACALHTRVWVACTSENLRTLNVRQTKRTRFN